MKLCSILLVLAAMATMSTATPITAATSSTTLDGNGATDAVPDVDHGQGLAHSNAHAGFHPDGHELHYTR